MADLLTELRRIGTADRWSVSVDRGALSRQVILAVSLSVISASPRRAVCLGALGRSSGGAGRPVAGYRR